ncbi:MAG: hypothetical protein L0J08_11745, partial [Micrococcaceae bacterium]|nr:hypothetical protein [Micrococcaceae bacterium]
LTYAALLAGFTLWLMANNRRNTERYLREAEKCSGSERLDSLDRWKRQQLHSRVQNTLSGVSLGFMAVFLLGYMNQLGISPSSPTKPGIMDNY